MLNLSRLKNGQLVVRFQPCLKRSIPPWQSKEATFSKIDLDMQQKLINGIYIALFALGAGLLLTHSVKAGERAECARWVQEAKGRMSVWYSTDWQREQCHTYGIVLPDEKP